MVFSFLVDFNTDLISLGSADLLMTLAEEIVSGLFILEVDLGWINMNSCH
jgi:hypothetical protein